MCPTCQDTGYIVDTFSIVYDGTFLPDYIEVPCACNPLPTDDDAPDWEPSGTAAEDFAPAFNSNRYEGL